MRLFTNITTHMEETLAAVLMAIMIAAVFVDVFGRYVFNHPIYGVLELCTLLFIWQVFLAGAGALRRGLHIGIEFVVERFPMRTRATTDLIMNLCVFVMVVIMGFMGWEYAWQAQTKRIHTLHLPYTWAAMAMPVSCLLMSVHLLKNIYQAARGVVTRVYQPSRQGLEGTGCVMSGKDR